MGPMRLLMLVAALAAALVLAACGGGGDKKREDPATSSSCQDVEKPKPRKVKLGEPTEPLKRSDKITAVVDTSCGSFEIALDTRQSPKTTASFVRQVEEGVYKNTTFHRIVPDFVIQGGDPEGTGQGGSGYRIEELPPDAQAYTRGIVAMAKTEVEPPGTSGSQFFVVTTEDAALNPEFALLGKVTKGFDVIKAIEKLGEPGGAGTPLKTVVIRNITLRKG